MRAYAAIEEFANIVQLQLDVPKTHFWATQAEDRKSLRNHNHKVILHTKDLGAPVNYTRRFTNHTIRTRIAKTQAFWGQLARSSATLEQRLRAIQAVAWPRCLHGIAAVALANEQFQKLRAQAMASLKWNKKGASSTIQFGLAHPNSDPGFVALLDTVLTFRNFCVPTVAFPLLTGIVTKPHRHFDPGPCAVLLARMHDINWQWIGDGVLCDHEGFHIHLLDAPQQLLKQRLLHAWERQVGYSMQDRKDFAGLGKVDGELTRSVKANTGEEQGIMRSILNGTFYTRDKQIHTGKIPSIRCPFCQKDDSLQHRIWECEFFHDIRQTIPQHITQFCSSQPECTRFHAWFVEDWTDPNLRRALYRLQVDQSHQVPPGLPDVLHLFSDGGCKNPTNPRLGVAGWAFCVAMLPNDEFQPVASGLLPGLLQTPLRAEIKAAVEAIRFAVLQGKKIICGLITSMFLRKVMPTSKGPPHQAQSRAIMTCGMPCTGQSKLPVPRACCNRLLRLFLMWTFSRLMELLTAGLSEVTTQRTDMSMRRWSVCKLTWLEPFILLRHHTVNVMKHVLQFTNFSLSWDNVR